MTNTKAPRRRRHHHADTLHEVACSDKPDISVSRHGSIALFRPLTEAASDWMHTHCPADCDHTYLGDALAVEPRYAFELAQHAIEDGLTLS